MRTLSSTLLAAQKSASFRPYLKVEVVDKLPGVARPILERLYTGSEPDFYHAATMPGDGSLIRARLEQATGNLYIQRVTNPGPGSDFGSWTLLDAAHTGANIVLASQGAQVLLFFVDPNQVTINLRESSDYGATWGPTTIVVNPPQKTVGLAADISSSGVEALFYIAEDQVIWVTKRSNGSWSPPLAWPYTEVTTMRGLGCVYGGDWNLALCGQRFSGENKVWTVIYGDGGAQAAGTWSPLRELTRASPGASMEFKNPFIGQPDVYRLFFVENYTGSGSYSRPIGCFSPPGASFADNRWREGVPFNLTSSYGVALAHGGGYLWLSTPSGVWRGSIWPTPLELTQDVLELELREVPGRGRATVLLRNDDGRYNSPGSGSLASVRKGSQVAISPGYHTSQGIEVSSGPALWILGWEHRCLAGRSTFLIHLEDGWSILEGWRARRQYTWEAGQASVQEILTFILSRVGIELNALSSSATFTGHKPDFTLHPAEDGATAVKRLLALVPDVLLFRGATACVKLLQDSDPADYSYGTDHSILEGRYTSRAGRYNRVQAYGQGVTGEAFAWQEVEELHDRLLQVHDRNLDTQAKAQERADALLEEGVRASTTSEICVSVNCGQELYDLVEVTDARAGLSAAKRRVLGLHLRYSTGNTPRYTHTLTLGGE